MSAERADEMFKKWGDVSIFESLAGGVAREARKTRKVEREKEAKQTKKTKVEKKEEMTQQTKEETDTAKVATVQPRGITIPTKLRSNGGEPGTNRPF